MSDLPRSVSSDTVVQFVINSAVIQLKPKRVILYGSRARGDFQERSDYDFAFDLDEGGMEKWSRFALDIRDTAPTLKEIDLVCLQKLDKDFQEGILREGIVIYDSKV